MQRKSKTTTFLLCYFLGTLGVHRFYLNRVITGLLMLITGGGLMIWWLVDCFLVTSDRLRDGSGERPVLADPDPEQPRAGFWIRAAALCADNLLIGLAFMVVGVAAAVAIPVVAESPGGEATAGIIGAVAGLGLVLAALLYFAVPLTRESGATWGKRAFGLTVVRSDGSRLGLGRALWRTVCYVLSALPFYLGFVMAGVTKGRRALHDVLAGTQVCHVAVAAPAATTAPPAAMDRPAPAPAVAAVAATPASVRRGGGSALPAGMMLLGVLLLGAAALLAMG